MSFKSFCDEWSDVFEFDGNIEDHNVPEEYKELITNVVSIVKSKIDRIDSIEIDFIQKQIESFGIPKMIDLFHNENTIIPESIFDELSYQMYDCSFEKLKEESIPIIKIIGIYLIISNANINNI